MGNSLTREDVQEVDQGRVEESENPEPSPDRVIELDDGHLIDEYEQEEIPDMKVVFNVGGQRFSTTAGTLRREPRSILARMLENEENRALVQVGRQLFIDRDGQAFGHILNYLRNGSQWILPSDDAMRNVVLQEAAYYGLEGLAQLIKGAQAIKKAVSTLQSKPVASAKVLILGASGVGKTSLLQQYSDGTFTFNQAATVGIDYITRLHTIEGSVVKFYFWDTSGQERYASITRNYYRGAKAAIFVYDVTNKDSFTQLKKWVTDFNTYSEGVMEGMACPQMILANKMDLETTRVISTAEGKELAEENGLLYAEASARTSAGVQQAFDTITQKVLQNPQLWDKVGGDGGRRVRRGERMLKRYGLCC